MDKETKVTYFIVEIDDSKIIFCNIIPLKYCPSLSIVGSTLKKKIEVLFQKCNLSHYERKYYSHDYHAKKNVRKIKKCLVLFGKSLMYQYYLKKI